MYYARKGTWKFPCTLTYYAGNCHEVLCSLLVELHGKFHILLYIMPGKVQGNFHALQRIMLVKVHGNFHVRLRIMVLRVNKITTSCTFWLCSVHCTTGEVLER